MNPLEQLVIQLGFESLKEFNYLCGAVDISTPKKLAVFKRWQEDDGTKAGLLALMVEDAQLGEGGK